ncbi:MAG: fumarylacetoacetate hydrolase family protein [Deltaproteobacteria bacterium]|nr:fumarylacetoacetate hydrolase family protein [Deltaproteobacteria bacterium]
MKLATLDIGTRDGELVVVKRDLSAWTTAKDLAPTLQNALDRWSEVEPALRARAEALESGRAPATAYNAKKLLAPLPRAYEWIDGSAYLNHVILVRKARKAEPPATLLTDPLIYQGGSGDMLAATAPISLRDEAWGCDFESEIACILGDVPQGTTAAQAGPFVKLLCLVNDVSLRNLIPEELAKGFGFVQSKPATAFSPVAVTPDELGAAWKDGRVHLTLSTWLNGERVGHCDAGPEMHFSFFDLIAHLAKTRRFTAGTILGSGTVSNQDRSRGVSCLAERRMIETIDTGAPKTPFLKFGDRVEIELFDAAGKTVFGRIDQTVTRSDQK